MNTLRQLLLFSLLLSSVLASPLSFDAGIAFVRLTGETYQDNPTPSVITEDKSAWGPHLGADYALSDKFSLRLGYQYVGGLTTRLLYAYPPGPGSVKPQVVVPLSNESDIHTTTFGLRLRLQVFPSTSLVLAPEVSWVREQTTSQIFSASPWSSHSDRLRCGASSTFCYHFNRHWAAELGYRFVAADLSFGRDMHMITAGVSFR